MSGHGPPEAPIHLGPRGIVTRQSTDVMAIDDPHVVQAIRLIREHACRGVGVEKIVEQVPISRSALYRRFTRLLGRSPKEEMTRVRMERTKELLVGTNLPISAVATRVGYGEAKHLIEVFRNTFGVTPLRYRRGLLPANRLS
jgi:LacI family transcriptional regulator